MQGPEGLLENPQSKVPFSQNQGETRTPPLGTAEMALVEANLDFARGVIGKDLNWHEIDEDLRQAAYLGLVEAASRFEDSRPAAFQSYAYHRIRGEAIEELHSRNFLRPKASRRVWEWWRTESVLAQELQRYPTPAEIASRLNLDDDQLEETERWASRGPLLSIDAAIYDDNDTTTLYLVADPGPNPEEEVIERLDRSSTVEKVSELIGLLTERQQHVITTHYFGGVGISSIAEQWGVSFQAVNQQKNIALGKLATALAA